MIGHVLQQGKLDTLDPQLSEKKRPSVRQVDTVPYGGRRVAWTIVGCSPRNEPGMANLVQIFRVYQLLLKSLEVVLLQPFVLEITRTDEATAFVGKIENLPLRRRAHRPKSFSRIERRYIYNYRSLIVSILVSIWLGHHRPPRFESVIRLYYGKLRF